MNYLILCSNVPFYRATPKAPIQLISLVNSFAVALFCALIYAILVYLIELNSLFSFENWREKKFITFQAFSCVNGKALLRFNYTHSSCLTQIKFDAQRLADRQWDLCKRFPSYIYVLGCLHSTRANSIVNYIVYLVEKKKHL